MAGNNCTPCTSNWYGDKCLRKCTCVAEQRCDNVLGCVNESTTTRIASTLSNNWRTEYVTQMITNSNETDDEMEINKPTTTKNINYGLYLITLTVSLHQLMYIHHLPAC
ncbi:Hypothetical predicted protein [Mytilus galloprovincialis]|uniref:Uncharacterized protein n=1 Tax=Mytilus galloprovincialis TaxID=29158 RepID=A0A8B6EQV4_MYTGA|nr:Hypothetical predicted protein [Mytilus galloprovincialis]